jgi:exonuclease III
MDAIHTVATLNIAGIASPLKMEMLGEFCRTKDIGILMLQEVTHEGFGVCNGYTAHVNVGTEQRGTAILIRNHLTMDRIDVLPSGRGIAGYYQGTYIVNIYAPSGAARKAEREEFFNVELSYLFRAMPQNYILGGDFNCDLTQADCTGAPQVSKGLETFVRGFGAKDSWTNTRQNQFFTHYTWRGATRIDREANWRGQ